MSTTTPSVPAARARRRPAPADQSVRRSLPKARHADECLELEQLPNIGPSLAQDLRRVGIANPADLRGADAYQLYRRLCDITSTRQDPCVLDTFLAITDFMAGAPSAPWWRYTAQRKARFGEV